MNDAIVGATLETLDIIRILDYLPHRYPFLLIDRIVDIRGDESCVGIKNVTINEPQFQGHFPLAPVMPGVLMIEAMAQTAGVIAMHIGYMRWVLPSAYRLGRAPDDNWVSRLLVL